MFEVYALACFVHYRYDSLKAELRTHPLSLNPTGNYEMKHLVFGHLSIKREQIKKLT